MPETKMGGASVGRMPSAYDRGVLDGKVATRLDHHAEQIAATNVLLDRTVDIAANLTSTVQTLTEARVTDAATRVATAAAVKDARDAHEEQVSSAWSPMAKLGLTVGIIVGVLGFVVGFWALWIT